MKQIVWSGIELRDQCDIWSRNTNHILYYTKQTFFKLEKLFCWKQICNPESYLTYSKSNALTNEKKFEINWIQKIIIQTKNQTNHVLINLFLKYLSTS